MTVNKLLTALISFCATALCSVAQGDLQPEFSSYGELVCGFAGESLVIISRDGGDTWTSFDFNKQYEGYYKPLVIKAIAAGDRRMAIVGTDDAGMPVMYFSFDGTVWSPRDLSYNEGGRTLYLDRQPESLKYDSDTDKMVMYCEDSTIFFVPNCSHCNSLVRTDQE